MNELNEFLEFLYENINDSRIEVSKKMKYGFRHFSISLYLEKKDDTKIDDLTVSMENTYNNIIILVDCRNNCIEFNVNMDDVVIEDVELTNKWANILEDHLNSKIENRVTELINNGLSKTDLLREYKLKKIIK